MSIGSPLPAARLVPVPGETSLAETTVVAVVGAELYQLHLTCGCGVEFKPWVRPRMPTKSCSARRSRRSRTSAYYIPRLPDRSANHRHEDCNAKRGDPPEFVAEPPKSRAGFLNAQPRGRAKPSFSADSIVARPLLSGRNAGDGARVGSAAWRNEVERPSVRRGEEAEMGLPGLIRTVVLLGLGTLWLLGA